MLYRRSVVAAGPLAAAFLFAGCTSAQVSQGVTDVGLINTAFQNAKPILASLGVPVTALTAIGAGLALLSTAAAAVASSGVLTTPTVQSVIDAVDQIDAAVAPLVTIPTTVQTILAAAETLLPILAAAVGISLAAVPKVASKVAPMTPDVARLKLSAAAKA